MVIEVEMLTGLMRDYEFVGKGVVSSYGALRYESCSVCPVLSALEEAMPMLLRLYQHHNNITIRLQELTTEVDLKKTSLLRPSNTSILSVSP